MAAPVRLVAVVPRAPWLADVQRAALACLASPRWQAWAVLATGRRSGLAGLQAASDEYGETVRYHFDPRSRPVASSLDAVRARGYGACADAAACLLALAHRQRIVSTLLIEAPAALPAYSHLRLMVGEGSRLVLDPYSVHAAPRLPSVDYVVNGLACLRGDFTLTPSTSSTPEVMRRRGVA